MPSSREPMKRNPGIIKRGLGFISNTKKKKIHQLMLQVFASFVNPFEYIHPDAFRGLLVLEHLKLKNTQLLQLPSLQHIGHSLTTLEVISSVHFDGNDAQGFTYLRKIEYIFMDDNVLSSTPLGLDRIANTLKRLNFAFNAINSLTSMEGVTFDKLYRLHLQYNNITHLHPEVLFTPRLQSLLLVGNHLVALGDVTHIHGAVCCRDVPTWQSICDRILGTVMGH